MKFQRIGTMSIEEGLSLIRAHMKKSKTQQRKRVEVLGQEVALNSLRLYTFATTPQCCSNPECSCPATHFAVEIQVKDGKPVNSHYQLNMYGKSRDGYEVLMTHDHTLARSLGGEDGLGNTSTMCGRCNKRKSIFESQEIERLRAEQRGALPPQRLPSAPPTLRTAQYLVAFLEACQARGMSEDEYRKHCDLFGTTLGPPLSGWNDKERDIARTLGLSRAGLRQHEKHLEQLLRPGVDLVVEKEPVFDVDPATLCPLRHRKRYSH